MANSLAFILIILSLIGSNLTLASSDSGFPDIRTSDSKSVKRIYRFGEGVHEIDSVLLTEPNSLLEGIGPGITILKVKNGISVVSQNPIIRNITIIGEGHGAGLHLQNTWSAKVQNVKIENYAIGMKLQLNDLGRKLSDGKTLNHWPSDLNQENWGSRITLSEIANVEITGPGDGIVLSNMLKSDSTGKKFWKPTDSKLPGEFMNATTIWGGHIAVKGRALVIGNGVFKTKLFGTYIDISPEGGIVMEEGSRGLTIIGVNLDLNSAATRKKTPRIVAPKRSLATIQMYATSPANIKIESFDIK